MKGKFIFQGIQEGEGESMRQIFFSPPLSVEFSIHEKIDSETGKENYPEDIQLKAYATFDFGMTMEAAVDVENNWLVRGGYEGLTKESNVVDILRNTIFFDLFHAFCHIPDDPNYSHYHWALKGWLQERALVKEIL
jgi:hypothetical protein